MLFTVRPYVLKRPGVIPGARGYKKIEIPPGTEIFCITTACGKKYWCGYLSRSAAAATALGLESCLYPSARRKQTYETLVAWNFKHEIPCRIAREKGEKA